MSAAVVRWLRVVEHCRAIDAVMYSQISEPVRRGTRGLGILAIESNHFLTPGDQV